MVLSMKLVSVAFDFDVNGSLDIENSSSVGAPRIKLPTVFEYLGYALCPNSSIFGPWISYSNYMELFVYENMVSFLF